MTWARVRGMPQRVTHALRAIPVTQRGALFIFCGLLVVLLTFGGLSVFSVQKAMQRITGSLMGSVQIAAQRVAEHVQHQRQGIEHLAGWPGIASTIDDLQAGRPGVSPPWVTLYYLASDTHDFGDCVFVVSRTGRVMWTKPPGVGLWDRDLSNAPGIHDVLTGGQTYVSGLLPGGFWPEPHVLIATVLKAGSQEIVGAVGTIVSATRLQTGDLQREVRELAEEVGARESYLLDADGNVITSSDPKRAFSRLADAPLLANVRQRRASFSVLNRDRLEVTEPIADTGWSLVLEHSSRLLYRDAAQLERNLLWVGALLILVALLVWMPFVESFVRPIRKLTHEAQRIAQGDLSNPVRRDGSDEIAELSSAFDHMREQIQHQQQLLQSQIGELREMNRLKAEFIANLSHEFRTPVHIMRGYTDLIIDGAFGQVPAALMEPLTAVSQQYTSLWDLLESCLDLAKIDAGEARLDIGAFDVCSLVRDVMDEFRLLLSRDNLRAIVTVPDYCKGRGTEPASICIVSSDRYKTQRILRNLVSNALKFTERGEVEIAVDLRPGTDTYALSVRDTGIGIRKDDQAIIFERFRQVDGSATRRYAGVGLGLNIVGELVRLLKGTVSVDSTVGVGSTFTVVLPKHLSAPTSDTDEKPPGSKGPVLS